MFCEPHFGDSEKEIQIVSVNFGVIAPFDLNANTQVRRGYKGKLVGYITRVSRRATEPGRLWIGLERRGWPRGVAKDRLAPAIRSWLGTGRSLGRLAAGIQQASSNAQYLRTRPRGEQDR